ncbi:hypothetical protein ABZX51_006230 [Aspergillus tubingensis]
MIGSRGPKQPPLGLDGIASSAVLHLPRLARLPFGRLSELGAYRWVYGASSLILKCASFLPVFLETRELSPLLPPQNSDGISEPIYLLTPVALSPKSTNSTMGGLLRHDPFRASCWK